MRFIKLLTFFILSILLGACGGGGSSGTITTPIPGGSATTTLSIDKTSLDPSLYETATVTAVFTNNGVPFSNLPVQFSVTPGYASFNPLDGKVTTDATGKAIIVLQIASNPPADGVGQVTVAAIINGANVSQTATFYVNKAALKLSTPVVSAIQSKITAGGNTTIAVQVVDANGVSYTAPSGVDVYFTAEKGDFIADNMVGKVRTNSAGVALVTYVAPYSTSTQIIDTITATLGNSVVSTTVTIDPRQASNIQYATSVPAKTTFGYNQSVSVSFRVTDSQGTSIPNTVVNFSIAGSPAGATLTNWSAFSDAYGYATTSIRTSTVPTTLWISATLANGTSAQSAVFSVTANQALSITTVTPAAPISIGSNVNQPVSFKVTDASGVGVVGQTVVLTAIDSLGNTSTAVTLQNNSVVTDALGTISTALITKTTAANLWVKATLQSDSKVFATSGMITVQSSNEGTVDLKLSSGTPKGGDTIMATVKFASLSPPPYSNLSVSIISDNESVVATTTGTTDSQGNANIILPVGNVTGRANVYAKVGTSLSPIVTVTSSSSSTSGGSLGLAVAPATPKPGDSITATVTYTNASAASLAGQTVTIVSNNAAVATNTYTGVTDNTGKAVIVLPVAATATQNTVITLYATSGSAVSPTAIVTVGSAVQDAATLTLTMQPTATVDIKDTTAGGTPAATAGIIVQGNKAVFTTSQGMPITGQPIVFTIDRVDNWQTGDQVSLNGTLMGNAATPAGVVTLNTDTSGTVLLPTIITGNYPASPAIAGTSNPHIFAVYWRATTIHNGITYVKFDSTLVTLTHTSI